MTAVTTTRTVVKVVEDGEHVTVSTVSTPVRVEVAQMGPQGPPGPPGSGGGGSAEYPTGGATGAALVKASAADSDVAWHTQTASDVGADPAGTAAAAVTAHEAAADPHPTYTTAAELSAALASYQPLDSDLTAIAALTTTSYGRAFLALVDAAAGRTALGLGTAATHAHGDYDAAGAAAAAQAASQPLDSDLTAIAALSTTAFGRSLLALADAAAAQAALAVPPTSRLVTAGTGLTGGGSLAADRSLAVDFGTGAGKVTQGNDSRLSDARTPTAHTHAGADISSGTVAAARLPLVTTAAQGVVPATGTPSGKFLRDDATWAAAGGGGGTTWHTISSGAPSSGLGADGDWCRVETSGALYRKVSGSWVLTGRLSSLPVANAGLNFSTNYPSWTRYGWDSTASSTWSGASFSAFKTTLSNGSAYRTFAGVTSWMFSAQIATLPGAGQTLKILGGQASGVGVASHMVAITNTGGCTVIDDAGNVLKTFGTLSANDTITFSGGPGFVLISRTTSAGAIADFVFSASAALAPSSFAVNGILLGATGYGAFYGFGDVT